MQNSIKTIYFIIIYHNLFKIYFILWNLQNNEISFDWSEVTPIMTVFDICRSRLNYKNRLIDFVQQVTKQNERATQINTYKIMDLLQSNNTFWDVLESDMCAIPNYIKNILT